MRFQNKEHESNLIRLMLKDKSNPKDMERLAMFYILAGNADLYSKVSQIYDFDEHLIKLECLADRRVDLCSSARALVKLGFNLYNGYEEENFTPMDILSNLDSENYSLAMKSFDVRFGHSSMEETNEEDDEIEM